MELISKKFYGRLCLKAAIILAYRYYCKDKLVECHQSPSLTVVNHESLSGLPLCVDSKSYTLKSPCISLVCHCEKIWRFFTFIFEWYVQADTWMQIWGFISGTWRHAWSWPPGEMGFSWSLLVLHLIFHIIYVEQIGTK